MKGFLEGAHGSGVLFRLNPAAKLACAFLVCIACFGTSNAVFLGCLLAAGLLLAAVHGMARRACALIGAVALLSAMLAVVHVLTTPGGAVIVQLPWGAVGTAGLVAALITIARLSAAALFLMLAFSTTRMADMTGSLVKNVRVPYRYAFALTSAVRFIPSFMDDMAAIMEAQTARGVRFDQAGVVGKVRLMVPLCVPLLVSSVRRTGDIAASAELRGFELRSREHGYKDYPFAARDAAACALCVAVLAAAVASSLAGPGGLLAAA